MTLLKPEKRAPRPRKRIARGKAPNKVRKTSRGALGRLADKLFSLIVRAQGDCRYHHYGVMRLSDCKGPMQPAHIVSRSYRSIRWDEDNAMPLCAGAHRYFTARPVEWKRFVDELYGAGTYAGLEARALVVWDKDIEGTVARLKARAAVLEIKC